MMPQELPSLLSKETDSLTRLFNKNKYNEMVSMYYPNVNNITVIFWDLNNLKIINDTYGHEYGDKALSALASVLYAHSDEQCRQVFTDLVVMNLSR